jgi:hypothetical protein
LRYGCLMASTAASLFREEEFRLLLIREQLHAEEQEAAEKFMHPGRIVLYAEQLRLEASLNAIRLRHDEARTALRLHRAVQTKKLCPEYVRLTRLYAEAVIARVPSIPQKQQKVDAAWQALKAHTDTHGCDEISAT